MLIDNETEDLLDFGIEDLLDDGFEGSKLEHSIFREIFFRNEIGSSSKKCLVTGAINFECESSRNADASLCSNSENSAITSHSSSKSPCLEETSNVAEGPREAFDPENSPKISATVKQNFGEVSGKLIKSSGNELANAETGLGKGPSAFPEKNASSISLPATDPGSEVITLRLVECSSQGLTSSCYLLKQHGEVVRGLTVREPKSSNCKSLGLEANDGKDIVMGKAIASPVSQESILSRLFAPSLAVNVLERSESPLLTPERPQDESYELDVSNVTLMKENLKKDPRPILQFHAVRLLCAAGWQIERRKRPSRSYAESVYRTPTGRPVREFAKAWRICGELLYADRCSLVEEDKRKQWDSMAQFLLDLSDTLVIFDKDANHSELAYKWRLLNPFVVVVMINRKVGALRKGEVVKAIKTPGTGRNGRGVGGDVAQPIAKRDWATTSSGSVLDGESALIVFEGNDHGCFNQSTSWPPTSLLAHGTGSTVVQSTSCLCDVSLHQDGITKCQVCDKDSADLNAGPAKEVQSIENNDVFLGSQMTDIEHHLLKSGDDCPSSLMGLVPYRGTVVGNDSRHIEEEDSQGYEASKLELADSFSPGDVSRKKTRRKSKRISEIEPSSLYQSGDPSSVPIDEGGLLCANGNDSQLELDQDEGNLAVNARTGGTCKKSSSLNSSSPKIQKTNSKLKRNCSGNNDSKIMKKKSKKCRIDDDDLLVSAIIKNKDFSPGTSRYPSRKKACKSKVRRKRKSQKRTCRLLPSVVDGGKHFKDGKWYSVGVRTVLSWLISTKVVSLNDVVEYRNPNDNAVLKDGLITRDGILCKCCSKMFTVSAFKIHAGFKLNRPCLNLFMDSGKSFTLCLLQAWSAEYKTRKGGAPAVKVDNDDRNDDSCGLCGDGGELICCDNCPSTFHQVCLSTQDLPEGSWYCSNCTCWICGSLVNDKDISSASYGVKCAQCEHKYHDACLKEKHRYQGALSEAWCCSISCQEVYSGLQSRVGVANDVSDKFTWTLLKCIHDDQKIHSAQRFALKAECNSRLSVALTIMEECFLSMVDPRTGIDMIPHVLYNWGSDFARLNFQGFYTLVLEKDDVLISVASVRVHGTTVAEMPLIATCSKYRRQGMCRILVNAIEEMLISLKVEKIVVAAIPDLVETWTKGFGFEPVEESEKRSLSKINFMVFPGTVLLRKTLYGNGNNSDGQSGDSSGLKALEQQAAEPHPIGQASEFVIDTIDVIGGGEARVDCISSVLGRIEELTEVGICADGLAEPVEKEDNRGHCGDETEAEVEVSVVAQLDEVEHDTLWDQFSKMSCEDSAQELGCSELGVGSNLESLGMYDRDDETQPGCDVNAR